MDLEDKRFIIGIDLGTTNSAVSYVDLHCEINSPQKPWENRIKIFKIPQLTGPGEFSRLSVLPSFLYIPGIYDISEEVIMIPWQNMDRHGDDNNFVGAFARDHGVKVPSRLVSSAKSWLCHSGVDRKARILPWGTGDDVFKISPVQATASYLTHIKSAWNSTKKDDEDLYFENQVVIITVPASFDEVARDLTVEAASLAGLHNITLLEEPLAAFYSWLIRHEQNWSKYIKKNELILVCDVGGGTTDFTLITLKEKDGSPRFERIAVGDHLILGGDNMDIALARRIEMRFAKLNPDRWKTLCHQCREAKEIILGGEAESRKITLMGEGSKLIAGTISADLKQKELEEIVLEGFFPVQDPKRDPKRDPKGDQKRDQKSIKERIVRKEATESGLPYEEEPGITRHLCEFLDRHKEDVATALGRENYSPDLILFNGGSLKPALIQEKIRIAIRHWFNEKDTNLPRVLENPDPELSVALGAAYYGLVKVGHGVRVGSGSSRAFYMGIEKEGDRARTKEKRPAICLVERGLEEGTRIELKNHKFEVLANQPVSFDIYSSSFRSGDKIGDLVEIDDSFTSMLPIRTVVKYGKKGMKAGIPVRIEANYTEMGTLALWCRSLISSHRWQLQFQLRDVPGASDVPDIEVFESEFTEQVCSMVRKAFTDRDKKSYLETIVKEIAKVVERPKEKWPLGFIRSISDGLLDLITTRNLDPEYESRWLNLIGFCIRPGFGDSFDAHRIKTLWKIYLKGPIHKKNAQVCSEWWIMWRRVAGGLKSGQQRQFLQEVTPIMIYKKGSSVKILLQERLEIWMALANMERLLVKDKIKWGRILLSEIKPKKSKPQHFWSLSRIGARNLLYGSLDRIIPPEEVSLWVETILSQNWRNRKPVGTALAQLARRTGDRTRDLDSKVIERIIDWMSGDMHNKKYFTPHLRFLKEVVPMAKQEESEIFGESLPSGIVLHN